MITLILDRLLSQLKPLYVPSLPCYFVTLTTQLELGLRSFAFAFTFLCSNVYHSNSRYRSPLLSCHAATLTTELDLLLQLKLLHVFSLSLRYHSRRPCHANN